MRQLAYLGVAALSAVALVGVGCSSDDNNNTTTSTGGANAATGGSKATGGANATTGGIKATGGANATTGGANATGGANSTGGVNATTGGVTGAGGATTTATTSAPAGGAPTSGGTTSTNTTGVGGGSQLVPGTNLINDTCQTDGAADEMGVSGGFYVYGDQNAEHPNGQSCTLPPSGTNVCEQAEDGGTKTGVCLAGSTIKDSSYSAWGCGIGLSLNSTGSGDGGTGKSPYSGPATCFQFTFTGTTGGLGLRVGYTQYADTSIKSQSVAPFKTVTFSNGWTGTVCFEDVECPAWPDAPTQGCPADLVAKPTTTYDIQITVPGGTEAADYDFCLTSVVPLKPQTP